MHDKSVDVNTELHSDNSNMNEHLIYYNKNNAGAIWYKGNTPYYYAESAADFDTAADAVHYWTMKDGCYILFDTRGAAQTFFTNDPALPS